MRIVLDQQEMSAILINWAKDKYKTHNVSVERLSDKEAMLQVTPQESEFSPADDKLISERMAKLQDANRHIPIEQLTEFSGVSVSSVIDPNLSFSYDTPSEVI